jgi:hypothetical protein
MDYYRDLKFIVICREDKDPYDGEQGKGRYTLATRQVFFLEKDAEEFAKGINPSRDPLVVPGLYHQLRFGPNSLFFPANPPPSDS